MSTPYWRFIHYFALHNLRDLILQVKPFFQDVSGAWSDPPTEDLVEWSRVLHNKVNALNDKYHTWDATDFSIAHKPTCDTCVNNLVYRFPWEFIHSVATQPNSMEFLKKFNTNYPCDRCRGGFFDEPQADETTLAWTYRNHNRVDPSFVIPVPPPVDSPVPIGYYRDPLTNILTVKPGFMFPQS